MQCMKYSLMFVSQQKLGCMNFVVGVTHALKCSVITQSWCH